MSFVIFATAAILWSITLLGWSLAPRRWRVARIVVAISCAAAVAAAASVISDVRSFVRIREAKPAALSIDVIRHGDWWEVCYARGPTKFTAANELHVPAGSVVAVRWLGAPLPSIAGSDSWSETHDDRILTGRPRVTEARFVALHPLLDRTVPVIVENRAAFDAWFDRESRPAESSPAGAAVFTNAGCAYCHRIRGAAEQASQTAPELTHFAARRSIAGVAPRDRAHLMGWIVNSRGLKPSSSMPRNPVPAEVLQQLTSYLESLR